MSAELESCSELTLQNDIDDLSHSQKHGDTTRRFVGIDMHAATTRAKLQAAALAALAASKDEVATPESQLRGFEHSRVNTRHSSLCSDSELSSFALSTSEPPSAMSSPRLEKRPDTVYAEDAVKLLGPLAALREDRFTLVEKVLLLEDAERAQSSLIYNEDSAIREEVHVGEKRLLTSLPFDTELTFHGTTASTPSLAVYCCSCEQNLMGAMELRAELRAMADQADKARQEHAAQLEALRSKLAVAEAAASGVENAVRQLFYSKEVSLPPRPRDFSSYPSTILAQTDLLAEDLATGDITIVIEEQQERSFLVATAEADAAEQHTSLPSYTLSPGVVSNASRPTSPCLSLKLLESGELIDVPVNCGGTAICPCGRQLQEVGCIKALSSPGWTCDRCERSRDLRSNGRRLQCKSCDYDLCGACNDFTVSLQSTGVKCHAGHALSALPAITLDAQPRWVCDSCERQCEFVALPVRYRCGECDYDLCVECQAQQLSYQVENVVDVQVQHRERVEESMQEPLQQNQPLAHHEEPQADAKRSGTRPLLLEHDRRPPTSPLKAQACDDAKTINTNVVLSPAIDTEYVPVTQVTQSSIAAGVLPPLTGRVLARSGSVSPVASVVPKVSPPHVVVRNSSVTSQLTPHSPTSTTAMPNSGANIYATAIPVTPATPSAGSLMSSRYSSPPTPQAPTYESFLAFHNGIAMPLMRRGRESLGQACKLLTEANAMHIHIFGFASPQALYNMACCFSLGVDSASLDSSPSADQDAAPGLPPYLASATSQEIAEVRLDYASSLLDAALKAGFSDVAQIATDDDLAAWRDRRPRHFGAIWQLADSPQQSFVATGNPSSWPLTPECQTWLLSQGGALLAHCGAASNLSSSTASVDSTQAWPLL